MSRTTVSFSYLLRGVAQSTQCSFGSAAGPVNDGGFELACRERRKKRSRPFCGETACCFRLSCGGAGGESTYTRRLVQAHELLEQSAVRGCADSCGKGRWVAQGQLLPAAPASLVSIQSLTGQTP